MAHEAFLTGWAPLAHAIGENGSALPARRAVEQAATEWHDKGRPPDRLWEHGRLAAALADTGAHSRAHDLVTDRVHPQPGSASLPACRLDATTATRSSLLSTVANPNATESTSNADVKGVAVSPDGHTRATGSDDETARLWDVRDLCHPHHLGTLTGHDNIVNSVVFSPNGHTVATAGNDDRAKLWETDVDSAAAQICSSTPTITTSEWEQYLSGLPYRPPCP